jgi:predicted MFS family arabinose efflux permease
MALIPDSPVAPVLAAVLLGAVGAINPIAGASISTIRQLVTPHHVLGRVPAVINVGTMTALTAGSFAGGAIADGVGLRATLLLGGLLPLLGLGWLLLSPVRHLRRLDSLEAQYEGS